MTVDKALLLKARLGEATVELDGLGEVRVRGLSRLEVLEMQNLDREAAELYLFSRGVIDPALTEDEVQLALGAAPAGDLQPVADAIYVLSGLQEGSVKDAAKSFRGGPVEEPRIHGGTDVGDDGTAP